MKKQCMGILLSIFLGAPAAFADSPEIEIDECNNIRQYLARAACDITKHSLDGFNTLENWRKARGERYKQFMEMMSMTDVPLDGERSPLNPVVTGEIQKDGYKIIKLYYESLPQLYVPANLYIPDNLSGPAPAVLYVCGHSRTQKVHYQTHPRKWAQLGFVCLIIETIQWGEVLGDHWGCYARGWFHWYSRGYTPGGVELWNAMRGLDLLCEREEVDPSRLGVTGISGGGSQSFYIAAADPRIKVAAPVCGGCTLESQVGQRVLDGHCDCMTPINTYGIDFQDIGALIAPRPLLVAQANRDGLNPIEAARTMADNIRAVYDLYDAGERFLFVETPGPHSYHSISRTKIFSFFIKHLMNKDVSPEEAGDIDESEESLLSEEELRVYVDGPPADDRTKSIQDTFQTMAKPPQITNESELIQYRSGVLEQLREKTFGAFPQNPPDLDVHLFYRSHGQSGGSAVYSFKSENGYRLKVDCRWREEEQDKKPVLLVLRSPAEQRWASEGFSSSIMEGRNRAFLEVRGVGDNSWGPELQWHVRRAAAWTGRTIASMQVWDVLRCLQTLRSLPNVNGDKIALAARDEMAVVAIYAALMDGGVDALYVQNPPATQNAASREDGRESAIEMLNCLRITDAPQAAGILYPTKLTFMGRPPETYNWAIQTYKAIQKEDSLKIMQ
ncbi:MAG: acetylxylan esterase [Candidatus Omnitrophica bacterium]|nr:acetylxylan esterase [Candidatus Omnitrophota bacterium]